MVFQIFLSGLLTLWPDAASVPAHARIEVELQDLQPVYGTVRVALYEESQFMKNPFRTLEKPVSAPDMVLVFHHLPPGDYAISLFHDINNNGKLDTNLLGIPLEPFGFSNNARGRFGPPDFEAAKFKAEGVKRMVIRLIRL